MKFLLDENVPNFYKDRLVETGYTDVIRINDFGKGLKDSEVFNIAVKEKRTIVTIDTDFFAYKKEKHYGIISISGKLAYPGEILLKVLEQMKKDERFSNLDMEDTFIRITHHNFTVTYKKKGKYKDVICKYKKNGKKN